jgi:hypothetical protein
MSSRPCGHTNAEFSASRATFISSLLRIRDINTHPITPAQLQEAAQAVLTPQNDESGECLPWVLAVVYWKLHDIELVVSNDVEALQDEFARFAVRGGEQVMCQEG